MWKSLPALVCSSVSPHAHVPVPSHPPLPDGSSWRNVPLSQSLSQCSGSILPGSLLLALPWPLAGAASPLSLSGMMFMESHTQPLSCIFHGAALWGRRRLIIKQHRAEIAAAPSCDYPAVPAAAPASCHPLVPRHRLDCPVLCLWDHNVPEHR